MRALILIGLLFGILLCALFGCALIETAPDPEPVLPVETETRAPPDFYNRGGKPCWRFEDMVVCDDIDGTWDSNEEYGNDKAQEE
jgi:hypothetical protein